MKQSGPQTGTKQAGPVRTAEAKEASARGRRTRAAFPGLAEIPLIDAADIRAALEHAFATGNSVAPPSRALAASTAAIHAAAWAQIKRLADPGITELDETQRKLDAIVRHTRSAIEAFGADLTVENDAAPVLHVTDARAPLTPLLSAIETGARAASVDDPTAAVNDAVRTMANLNLWADAAARAFAAGRQARDAADRRSPAASVRGSPIHAAVLALSSDDPSSAMAERRTTRPRAVPAHAGRDLGLVVLAAYAELTGRPVRVSRRSSTKSHAGGDVSGPLVRFVFVTFERIRQRMAQEPTLQEMPVSRAFNPSGATIAAWAREFCSIG